MSVPILHDVGNDIIACEKKNQSESVCFAEWRSLDLIAFNVHLYLDECNFCNCAVPVEQIWPHYDSAHEECHHHGDAINHVRSRLFHAECAQNAPYAHERRRHFHQVDEAVHAIAKVAAQILSSTPANGPPGKMKSKINWIKIDVGGIACDWEMHDGYVPQ